MFRFVLFMAVLPAADFEIKDQAEFKKLFSPGAKVERLATDMRLWKGRFGCRADSWFSATFRRMS